MFKTFPAESMLLIQTDVLKIQKTQVNFQGMLLDNSFAICKTMLYNQLLKVFFLPETFFRPWLTGIQWIRLFQLMNRWMTMVAHGVQEQKWSRNTSNSGLSRQLLMQRYENTVFGNYGSTSKRRLFVQKSQLNVVFYTYMFE